MKKNIALLIFLIILITFFSFFKQNTVDNTASINNKTFIIEVAKTENQKEVGLSKYKRIDNNFGMYFPFNDANYYSFWMKNMKFPIDIIYIYKNEIVDIFKNVQNPKSSLDTLKIYTPSHVADSVLEINAGLSDKYGFNKGQNVRITIK